MMVRAKEHLPLSGVQIHVGDGIGASFTDAQYRLAGSSGIVSGGHAAQIDCLGIGSFVKLVFPKAPAKTPGNPSAQVGLQTLRVWGRPMGAGGAGVKNEATPLTAPHKLSEVDSVLLQLGVPLNSTDWPMAAD